jgi:uncharacterized damage-inducible protein DinB
MTTEPGGVAAFYTGWTAHQDLITGALAPLTAEQLGLRVAPEVRTIGEIATHMIGARARWFHGALGQGGDDLAALQGWDRPGQPTRTAAELVEGLRITGRVIQAALASYTAADLMGTVTEEYGGQTYTFTRQYVVWHVIEHDIHHGGEISLTLGAHGLAAPDL